MNYKLIIQYDGTRYDGWQRQGNTTNTIQGKLEAVLERMEEAALRGFWFWQNRCRSACLWTGGECTSET